MAVDLVDRLRAREGKMNADCEDAYTSHLLREAAERIGELEDALNAADRFLPRYVQVGVFGLPKDNEDYRAMAKVYKALGRYVPRSENALTGKEGTK